MALRGESWVAGAPLSAKALRGRFPSGYENLSPNEKTLMSDGKLFSPAARPDRTAMIQAVWRYEAAATLFWALGLRGELPFPHETCSASSLVRFTSSLDAEHFVKQAQLRPAAEILNELDRVYRLQWVAEAAASKGRQTALGFDPGVVLERLHTLNWLSAFENAPWDEVTTPT